MDQAGSNSNTNLLKLKNHINGLSLLRIKIKLKKKSYLHDKIPSLQPSNKVNFLIKIMTIPLR